MFLQTTYALQLTFFFKEKSLAVTLHWFLSKLFLFFLSLFRLLYSLAFQGYDLCCIYKHIAPSIQGPIFQNQNRYPRKAREYFQKKEKKMSEQSNIKWLQMLSVHISNINIQEKVFIILEFHHICFPIRHILGYGWPQLIQIFCPTCNSLYEEKK